MFSSSAGRVVRTSASHGVASANASRCIAARAGASGHQRRLSSSKASVPPNEDEGRKVAAGTSGEGKSNGGTAKTAAAPAAKTRKSRARTTSAVAKATTGKKVEKKEGEGWIPLNKLFPEMPEPVRATAHLKREDIQLMELFAGHLPISPTHVLPPSATDAQFASVFTPKPKWQVYTETAQQLSSAIDALESTTTAAPASSSPSEGEGIIHLDASSTSAAAMDPMMQAFRNNRPPPPPRPIEDMLAEMEKGKVGGIGGRKKGRKGKSWQTTITVTEWMDGMGHSTFRAASSPIVRLPSQQQGNVEVVVEEPSAVPVGKQPFLERMRTRQQKFLENRGGNSAAIRSPLGKRMPKMILISVKRQRKAKMKKHKLKKLRKRTRNLRRKLGKL